MYKFYEEMSVDFILKIIFSKHLKFLETTKSAHKRDTKTKQINKALTQCAEEDHKIDWESAKC